MNVKDSGKQEGGGGEGTMNQSFEKDEEEDSGKHMNTTEAGQLQHCVGKCPARA